MKSATRAVITGGAGFIGSHLARELSSCGYEVTIYGREKPELAEFEFLIGDVRDKERLRHGVRGADIVFHLAGAVGTDYLVERAREAVETNINGSLNLYDLARDLGFTVVEIGVIPEWLSPYMITKKAAARFGAMYHAELHADIKIVELSHVYGPGQRAEPYQKAIPAFITRALQGEPLTVFGGGHRAMDCLYVKDAVRALKMVGECETMAGRAIPFGSGSAITVLELAKKVVAVLNSGSEIVFAPMRKGEPPDHCETEVKGVDLSSWLTHFDWKPETSLDDGLRQTIEYYRAHLRAVAG